MGFFDKLRNSERMRKIRQSGRDGEEQFRRDKFLSDIKRKHHGRDFEERVTDWTGKTKKIPWEVKRNKSPLSKKQKRTRNLHVRRYIDTPYGVEARTEDKHGNRLEQNMLSGKYEKVRKQEISFFGSNSDSTTKKKRKSKKRTRKSSKRKSDSIWGTNSSVSAIFGPSSKPKKKRTTTKKRKSKRKSDSIWGSTSSYDSLFGTGSSKRKSRRKSDDWSVW